MAPSAIEHYKTDTNYKFLTTDPVKTCVNHSYGVIQQSNAQQLIGQALKQRVHNINPEECESGEEDAFFVADLGEVYRQHLRWKLNLGRVKPHYAVKCNPDHQVLSLLAALGAGFDCASKAEIEQVLDLGIDPSRIIFAQPCKISSHLKYANKNGVKQVTFDNAEELYKTKKFCPDAELLLRIQTDDSASLCRLSMKFGAQLVMTKELLELAKELGLNVVGVAFHVGSGASDPNAFLKAVQDARFVFDQGESIGFHMHTLDVGGGYCSETFETMATVLSAALDEYFPPSVRIIGEPGRYYVSTAFTLACLVTSRRTVIDPTLDTASYMLYMNDGVYGNFSSIIFDHQHPVPRILTCGDKFMYGEQEGGSGYDTPNAIEYSIWGPTCDGIDVISERTSFRETMDVGDWLYFEEMGAYTKCSATRFNGFTNRHEVVYVCSDAGARVLLGMH